MLVPRSRVVVAVRCSCCQEIASEEQGFVERKGGGVRTRDDGKPGVLDDFLKPARDAGAAVHLKNLYNDRLFLALGYMEGLAAEREWPANPCQGLPKRYHKE